MNDEWERIEVVFKLKSPLHIGYMPFKSAVVSPTRYYVPARNFWGAITKRITEYLYTDPIGDCPNSDKNNKDGNNETTCYQKIGEKVMDNFRFSYFYLYDGKTIYFPKYTDEGLKYGDITKAEFEHRFISSRVSTAINKIGTAKDESLHEIEFINNKFRDENGDLKDMKISGCIWIKGNTKIDKKITLNDDKSIFINDDDFNIIIEELILGGESKYGFGHVVLDPVNKVRLPIKEVENNNKEKDDMEEVIIEIEAEEALPAHLKYDKNLKFKGNIEPLTGRGYFYPKKIDNASEKPGEIISKPEYYLSPGTIILEDNNKQFKINWDGTLEVIGYESN